MPTPGWERFEAFLWRTKGTRVKGEKAGSPAVEAGDQPVAAGTTRRKADATNVALMNPVSPEIGLMHNANCRPFHGSLSRMEFKRIRG
jgi:hypothetical protein